MQVLTHTRAAGLLALWLCALLSHGAQAELRTATNGILTVEIEDAGTGAGQFAVVTGEQHPTPQRAVTFAAGTSYFTLRDNTAREVWTNAGSLVSGDIAPYTARNLQEAPVVTTVSSIAGGFRTVYAGPNWTITQEVVITGTTVADSTVRQSLTVNNVSAVTRSYGLRSFWDWELADVSYFRTRSPDGAFATAFAMFANPAFQAFEVVDDPAAPTLSGFASVQGASPAPDRVGHVPWLEFYASPWDAALPAESGDGASVHYWGFATPLSLAPGASATFVTSLATDGRALGLSGGGGTPPPTTPPSEATVVEYFHAGFGHYFITHLQTEISALDAGQFSGWARTGRTFKIYAQAGGGLARVCRFFTTAFPPKSSHFYSAIDNECTVLRGNTDWTFEADVFWVVPANPVTGACPAGTLAVYRLYNDGQGGAPNHRYTIDPVLRAQMIGELWTPEGFGPQGVGFCAPP